MYPPPPEGYCLFNIAHGVKKCARGKVPWLAPHAHRAKGGERGWRRLLPASSASWLLELRRFPLPAPSQGL